MLRRFCSHVGAAADRPIREWRLFANRRQRLRRCGAAATSSARCWITSATLVAPGVTTMDLERAAEKKIKELGAKPAFKGYYDYPCVLCTSINEEIVHGIPSAKRALKAGDIVSIDCGVVLDGYYGDSAITVPVGDSVAPELRKLLEVTEASLYKGIEQVQESVTQWAMLGAAVQEIR